MKASAVVAPGKSLERASQIKLHNELISPIPRITVVPSAGVTSGYNWFDLSCSGVHLQPVDEEILIRELHSRLSFTLTGLEATAEELRLENYLVRALVDSNDISFDQQAGLLYHLARQLVAHLRGYLADDTQVRNVLIYHNKTLADLIHAQMQPHYFERATSSTVTVSKNFQTLRDNSYPVAANESLRNFRTPVEDRLLIRGMIFGGFTKSLYTQQKFDSDAERRFAVLLEDDPKVEKWVKPGAKFFQIEYRPAKDYEPGFVVETQAARYLCEPKRSGLLTDPEVQHKARAATTWCARATTVSDKPWHYLLIPDDAIKLNATLTGLAAAYTITAPAATAVV